MTLPAISQNGFFSLLTLDQVVPISERLGLNLHESAEAVALEEIYIKCMQTWGSSCSGVLLAPEFGYPALEYKPEKTGPAFALERRLIETDPLSVPILTQGWGVEAVRGNYGVAKLELYYNPTEQEAATKRQLVAEVYDYCQHEGIDLILEVLLYVEATESQYPQIFPELQLQAVQELRRSCSVMALEYPLSALNTVTVTAELDIPWILTTRDTPYDEFKEQLRTALESGAVGFMGVEPFLPSEKQMKEAPPALEPRTEFISNWIKNTGRDRVLEITRIVKEAAQKQQ